MVKFLKAYQSIGASCRATQVNFIQHVWITLAKQHPFKQLQNGEPQIMCKTKLFQSGLHLTIWCPWLKLDGFTMKCHIYITKRSEASSIRQVTPSQKVKHYHRHHVKDDIHSLKYRLTNLNRSIQPASDIHSKVLNWYFTANDSVFSNKLAGDSSVCILMEWQAASRLITSAKCFPMSAFYTMRTDNQKENKG